jgi:hypothetical protein
MDNKLKGSYMLLSEIVSQTKLQKTFLKKIRLSFFRNRMSKKEEKLNEKNL